MKPYPTRNGLPISTAELGLEPSRMNPDKKRSWSNHHLHFNSGFYKSDFIFNALRNLEGEQEPLLKDQHNLGRVALHALYSPPERPTHAIAMDRLEEGVETGEHFKVWDIRKKKYVTIPFDRACWEALKRYYNITRE